MKTVIELLEDATRRLEWAEECKPVSPEEDPIGEAHDMVEEAIELLQSPRWETPEQRETRTGKAWPEDWAVYALYENNDGETKWFYGGYGRERKRFIKRKTPAMIVIATEAGPPPDDWRPDETGNDV